MSKREDLGPQISRSQFARGTLQQARAQFLLQVGNTAAHRRRRHLQPLSRAGKTLGIDYSGKEPERIQIGHRVFHLWKSLSQLYRYSVNGLVSYLRRARSRLA